MTGNVTSNIENNSPDGPLPGDSFYRPIENTLFKLPDYSEVPTRTFAEGVANDVLNGISGFVFAGGGGGAVFTIKWIVPFIPRWMTVITFKKPSRFEY